MKYLKLLLVTITACLSLEATAQTSTNSNNPFVELGQGISALGSSTNWGFVGYGTLGDKKVNGQQAYGGGLLGIYSLNNFIGLGGGVDELTGLSGASQTTIISANVQLQMPLRPLTLFSTNSFAQSFAITPFLYSGLGTPIGGALNQSAISHEGEGINVDLFKFSNWQFGVGFAYIERQNAGAYSGNYKNIFLSLHHPF